MYNWKHTLTQQQLCKKKDYKIKDNKGKINWLKQDFQKHYTAFGKVAWYDMAYNVNTVTQCGQDDLSSENSWQRWCKSVAMCEATTGSRKVWFLTRVYSGTSSTCISSHLPKGDTSLWYAVLIGFTLMQHSQIWPPRYSVFQTHCPSPDQSPINALYNADSMPRAWYFGHQKLKKAWKARRSAFTV